ncbi:hypothetical protein IE53DRAFT_385112 [Violaceomyces palustris]|uniref:Uncharacterized protein n=1 Tax=Violaceomyces palustris TaxID=1673888 RepID=A0ACD0P2V1_9BASI|nr:hypothetical protein IE53DRAFT_385112 [Violaceomyces palustris]
MLTVNFSPLLFGLFFFLFPTLFFFFFLFFFSFFWESSAQLEVKQVQTLAYPQRSTNREEKRKIT